MRQGQPQNRQRSRGRGNNNNRNNNNRNQMNRSIESNGPDVRIRGTAAHIAEKYSQLANDALTSGDTVAAQSYWQFAEHYNRLIATAQEAQAAVKEEQEAKRVARGEADGDSEGDDNKSDTRNERRPRRNRNRDEVKDEAKDVEANAQDKADAPQPTMDDVPAEVALAEKPAVEAANGEEASTKPRRSKRPRKSETSTTADDNSAGLPSFVTGGE